MYALFAGFRYDVEINHKMSKEIIFSEDEISSMKNMSLFFELIFLIDMISQFFVEFKPIDE